MAAGSNTSTSYHYEEAPASSVLSRHSISFSSSGLNSSKWDMVSMGSQYGMHGLASMIMPMNSNSAAVSDSGISQAGTCSGAVGPDNVFGLNHDTGLAVEWSVEEQYTLERSLDKYKNEPSIMKYIRIAATLPDKTVRDVALRCQWMSRKRRKQEEHYSGKKVANRKEKSVGSSPKPSLSVAQPFNTVTQSSLMQQFGLSGFAPSEASCDTVKNFLRQNLDVFDQISANMSTMSIYKLQENIELFCRAKNNITTVLNEYDIIQQYQSYIQAVIWIIKLYLSLFIVYTFKSSLRMKQLPGLPQLPMSINEDLMNQLPPIINRMQTSMHWQNDTHLKQERL